MKLSIAKRRELKNCVPLVLGKRKRENNKAVVKLHNGQYVQLDMSSHIIEARTT
jgi:hypothetical protein